MARTVVAATYRYVRLDGIKQLNSAPAESTMHPSLHQFVVERAAKIYDLKVGSRVIMNTANVLSAAARIQEPYLEGLFHGSRRDASAVKKNLLDPYRLSKMPCTQTMN